jgi:hypothetical protein
MQVMKRGVEVFRFVSMPPIQPRTGYRNSICSERRPTEFDIPRRKGMGPGMDRADKREATCYVARVCTAAYNRQVLSHIPRRVGSLSGVSCVNRQFALRGHSMADPYFWEPIFQQAVRESDASQLHARIVAADIALSERQLEIARAPNGFETDSELRAIRAAADALLALKVEKLGWKKVTAVRPKDRGPSGASAGSHTSQDSAESDG